jgi:hypothetical protein
VAIFSNRDEHRYGEKFALSPESYIGYIHDHLDPWLLTPSGRAIAYEELAQRKQEWLLPKRQENLDMTK